jgi:hypothetical protein
MNISSIVKHNNAISFGALKNSRQPEKSNSKVSSNNYKGDVFTSNKEAKKNIEMEKRVVVTYDDIYIFETPKDTSDPENGWDSLIKILKSI